jgi:hypothetical protein
MDRVVIPWGNAPSPERLIGERSTLGSYHAGECPNCFTGDTVVSSPSGIKKLWRAPYSGDIIEIEIESGASFSATPNHPILTPDGWVAVGLLNEGDELLHGFPGGDSIIKPDMHNDVTTFENLFNSASLSGNHSRSFGLDFHGDMINDYVDEISLNGDLVLDLESDALQGFGDFVLAQADSVTRDTIASIAAHVREAGFYGGSNERFAFFGGVISHSDIHSIRPGARRDSDSYKPFPNCAPINLKEISNTLFAPAFVDIQSAKFIDRNLMAESSGRHSLSDSGPFESITKPVVGATECSRDFNQSFSFGKHLARVRKKISRVFSGHVYTLESGCGFYGVTSTNIIAQNCRCYPAPLLRFSQIDWPARVYQGNQIQRMTLAAFRKIAGREVAA